MFLESNIIYIIPQFTVRCVSMGISSEPPHRDCRKRKRPPREWWPKRRTEPHSGSCHRWCPDYGVADDSTVLRRLADRCWHCCHVDRPSNASCWWDVRGAFPPIRCSCLQRIVCLFCLLVIAIVWLQLLTILGAWFVGHFVSVQIYSSKSEYTRKTTAALWMMLLCPCEFINKRNALSPFTMCPLPLIFLTHPIGIIQHHHHPVSKRMRITIWTPNIPLKMDGVWRFNSNELAYSLCAINSKRYHWLFVVGTLHFKVL